jgi:O-antigen/teichoic acid export membrane protein
MRQEVARLAKNTLIYGIGGLLNRFVGFLFLPIFTAYLTPADYGIYAILGLVTFVTTSVFSLGVGAGIGPCYFAGNRAEQKEGTIWTAFLLLVLSGASLVGFGLWLAPGTSVIAFQTPVHAYLVGLTVLGAALNILMIPFTLRLQFEEQAWTFVVLTLVSTSLSLAVSLWMIVGLGRGIRGLVEAGLIGQLLSMLLLMAPTVSTTTFRINWTVGKELLRLSLPLVPSFAFLFILQHGNKYLLQWMQGLDAVGIYSIGFNFGMVLNLLVSAFQIAWYPYFMSFLDRQEEACHVFGRIFTYYVLGFGGLCLLFFVLARPIVALMTQPAFHAAYGVVGLSATAQLLLGAFSLLLPGVYFAKKLTSISLVQGIAAIACVGLNLLLAPRYGHVGAAVALVGGMLFLVVLQHTWNVWRRYLPTQYEWSRLGAFAAIFLAYAFLTLWDLGLPPLGLVLLLAALAGILPALLLALLTPEERAAIRGSVLRLLNRDSVRLIAKAWLHGR